MCLWCVAHWPRPRGYCKGMVHMVLVYDGWGLRIGRLFGGVVPMVLVSFIVNILLLAGWLWCRVTMAFPHFICHTRLVHIRPAWSLYRVPYHQRFTCTFSFCLLCVVFGVMCQDILWALNFFALNKANGSFINIEGRCFVMRFTS